MATKAFTWAIVAILCVTCSSLGIAVWSARLAARPDEIAEMIPMTAAVALTFGAGSAGLLALISACVAQDEHWEQQAQEERARQQ